MKLAGKTAIITGGTGGLGSATAKEFAIQGAKVIITDLDDAVGRILSDELGGEFFQHDVTDFDRWKRIVATVLNEYGKIDILVQCAGIEGDFTKDVLNTEIETWNKVMAINLTGTFLGCRAVVPQMMEAGSGSVINLSSIASFMATSGPGAYGASKAAVQHLTTSVAVAASKGGRRIRVNSVHPGVIKTRMTDNIVSEMAQALGVDEILAEKQLMSGVPFQERGTPQDVAKLILYLASDDSVYVTGSAYQIDGGWHLKDTA